MQLVLLTSAAVMHNVAVMHNAVVLPSWCHNVATMIVVVLTVTCLESLLEPSNVSGFTVLQQCIHV